MTQSPLPSPPPTGAVTLPGPDSAPPSPPATSKWKLKESRRFAALEHRNRERVKAFIVQSLRIAADETASGDRALRVRRDREGSAAMLQLAAADFHRRKQLEAVRAKEREGARTAERRRDELDGWASATAPIPQADRVRRKRMNEDVEQEQRAREARREFAHQKYLKIMADIRVKKEKQEARFDAVEPEEPDAKPGPPEPEAPPRAKPEDATVAFHKKFQEEVKQARQARSEFRWRKEESLARLPLQELEAVLKEYRGQPERLKALATDFGFSFDVLELEVRRSRFF
jgi:hypothetical protein